MLATGPLQLDIPIELRHIGGGRTKYIHVLFMSNTGVAEGKGVFFAENSKYFFLDYRDFLECRPDGAEWGIKQGVTVQIQGVFFTGPPPKMSKYRKVILG